MRARARVQSKQGLADRSRIGRRIQPETTFSLTAGRGALSGRATAALALLERRANARGLPGSLFLPPSMSVTVQVQVVADGLRAPRLVSLGAFLFFFFFSSIPWRVVGAAL
nr:hypothetical protein [Pandoravirus massiliensis]